MKKRRRSENPGLFLLGLSILLVIVIVQFVSINRLKSRLSGITIFTWESDSLLIVTGRDINTDLAVFTPDFLNHASSFRSPFGDDSSLAELLDKYVKYGRSDMYGSPRRTGDIRRIHEGIDLYVDEDTPVYPLFPVGIVTDVSDDPNYIFQSSGYRGDTFIDSVGVEYGKIIRILYPQGFESLYAHLNEVYVKGGDIVTQETVVGLTGYTGNIRFSGKPSHLHLELRTKDNGSFDPEHRLHYSELDKHVFINKVLQNTGKNR